MPSRSFLSIPAFLGTLPTSNAQFAVANPTFKSDVASIPFNKGKAQSCNSITTPSRAGNAGSISIRRKATGWSGPNIAPEAMRNNSEYPI